MSHLFVGVYGVWPAAVRRNPDMSDLLTLCLTISGSLCNMHSSENPPPWAMAPPPTVVCLDLNDTNNPPCCTRAR